MKLGCTQAMLLCLDREHRLAYLLGEVFDLNAVEGAAVLDLKPAAFRKRLSRARGRIHAFMEATCGLVSSRAPCRCRKQIGPCIRAGLLDPTRPVFSVHPARARRDPVLWRYYQTIESVHRPHSVFRQQPAYAATESVLDALRRLIETSQL